MVSIYLIEDINDLKYVGSTTQKLYNRFSRHKSDKKIGNYCSSSKLNLYNCIIIELERCNKEDRKERERYYINKIDCVNEVKLNGRDKDNRKKYNKEWCEKNKEKIDERIKVYHQKTWYCSDCKCTIKHRQKAKHLKTPKHQRNKK